MARKVVPLTDTEIKKAKPAEKDYKIFDGGGLFLLIKSNGGKWWRLKYLIDGKEKLISLGTYPEISLSEARTKREQLRSDIAKGIDPSAERKEEKQTIKEEAAADQIESERKQTTFEKVAREFLQSTEDQIVPRYHNLKLARMENHFFPYIGSVPIDEVTRKMIIECVDRLKAADKAETARRSLNALSQIYRYAVTREMVPHNIIVDIDKRYLIGKKEEKHFPTITDPKELGRLFRAIDNYHGEVTVKCGLKLSYLTAQRPYNIRFAEWDEFDLKKNEWSIPAEKMKMKRPHIVPITPQIRAILDELEPQTKGRSRFLFPALTSNVRPISENTINQALRRLGYGKEDIVAHGFRAMFSTLANEHIGDHGCHSDVIERHLAHVEKNKVKGAYNRAEYMEERRELIQWWCNFCDEVNKREVSNEI